VAAVLSYLGSSHRTVNPTVAIVIGFKGVEMQVTYHENKDVAIKVFGMLAQLLSKRNGAPIKTELKKNVVNYAFSHDLFMEVTVL
jgi:hypothetical protein